MTSARSDSPSAPLSESSILSVRLWAENNLAGKGPLDRRVHSFYEDVVTLCNRALVSETEPQETLCDRCRGHIVQIEPSAAPCVVVPRLQIASDMEDSMPREPGYNDTSFVRRETTWRPAPKAWHVVDKDGNFARNGFIYEYSADLVTCADVDWPANAPHKAIPLYDMATLDRYCERGERS